MIPGFSGMVPDPLSAASDLVDITDKLGILDAVKRRLISQRDPAAARLAAALDEMRKNYEVVDGVLVGYLSLWFDREANPRFEEDRRLLVKLEGGGHEVVVRQAKSSCGKIWAIHEHYLRGWFSRVLSKDEARVIEDAFKVIADSDMSAVYLIYATSEWVTDKAKQTLGLVKARKLDEAQQVVDQARLEIEPARVRMRGAMKLLGDLQATFTEVAGIV
jgi:hypothetical protein